MDAWGVNSFENADARDWCQAYREMGLAVAGSTLDVALGDLERASLSPEIACRAVAAVEAVAYALGRGSDEAKDAFEGAPEADPNAAQALIEKCNSAIDAITGGSGLSAHWESAGNHAAWAAAMEALRTRLNGAAEMAAAPSAPSESGASPAAQPLAGSDASVQEQLTEIRDAIGGLESDIEVLRQELREGLVELARHIAKGGA